MPTRRCRLFRLLEEREVAAVVQFHELRAFDGRVGRLRRRRVMTPSCLPLMISVGTVTFASRGVSSRVRKWSLTIRAAPGSWAGSKAVGGRWYGLTASPICCMKRREKPAVLIAREVQPCRTHRQAEGAEQTEGVVRGQGAKLRRPESAERRSPLVWLSRTSPARCPESRFASAGPTPARPCGRSPGHGRGGRSHIPAPASRRKNGPGRTTCPLSGTAGRLRCQRMRLATV